MNKTDWKDTAELVGIAAIVASLIFVGLQLRQESAIAARESSSDFVEAGIEMAQLFSDNRQVWRKALDGEFFVGRFLGSGIDTSGDSWGLTPLEHQRGWLGIQHIICTCTLSCERPTTVK